MKSKKILSFLFISSVILILFSLNIYNEIEKNAIKEFNKQQMIIAKEAALAIGNLFENYYKSLYFLSKNEDIIRFNDEGIDFLDVFYNNYLKKDVTALTLVDKNGIIKHTWPYNKDAIGKNISYQKHVEFIKKNHKPVVSDVFHAVQGYDAVAMHVPIIQNSNYIGSLAILIPFEKIAEAYIKNLKIGKDGFSFLINNEGTMLYCSLDTNIIGHSAYAYFGKNEGGSRILDNMLKGKHGQGTFLRNVSSSKKSSKKIKYQAVYYPVKLQNNYWVIIIASSEKHILYILKGLRNKLFIFMTVFLLIVLIHMLYMYKASAILHYEKKRKKAESELIKYRNFLNSIIDSIPSLLVGIDKDCNIIQWNKKAEEYTGVQSNEAIGKTLESILPQFKNEIERIKETIKKGKPDKREKVPREKNGSIILEDIDIVPLVSIGIEGAVIRIDDVTKRIKIEEIIIQSEKMLSLGGLAAGMAHEINNPLAGIIQNIQVLRNRLHPDMDKNIEIVKKCGIPLEGLKKYIEKRDLFKIIDSILESGKRASNIVENMLGFSRKPQEHFQYYDITELLDKTVELAKNDYELKKKYDFKNISIVKKYERNIPEVKCESNSLQQVFLNLLKNSAYSLSKTKDINKNPEIILRLGHKKDTIKIEVEDNGPGISDVVIKRIFEPFYTTKKVGEGTGLGLFVSYFIITERHKGTMTMESVVNRFTRATIYLPIDSIANI